MTYLVFFILFVVVVLTVVVTRIQMDRDRSAQNVAWRINESDTRLTRLFNELTEKFGELQNSCIDQIAKLTERLDDVVGVDLESTKQLGADLRRLATRLDGVSAAMESLKRDRLNTLNTKLNRANESAEEAANKLIRLDKRVAEMRRDVEANREAARSANAYEATILSYDQRISAVTRKVAELNDYVLEHAHKERLHQRGESLPARRPLPIHLTAEEVLNDHCRTQPNDVEKIFLDNIPPEILKAVEDAPERPLSEDHRRTLDHFALTIDAMRDDSWHTPHRTPEDDVSYLDPSKDPFNDGR